MNKEVMTSAIRILAIFFTLTIASCGWNPFVSDEERIHRQMDLIIDFVDSSSYEKSVSFEEHIVLSYHLALGRTPSPQEFLLLSSMRDEDLTLKRSEVLALVLKNKARAASWSRLDHFLLKVGSTDFKVNASLKATADELTKTSTEKVIKSMRQKMKTRSLESTGKTAFPTRTAEQNRQYNTYFGYLHAHSHLSDGQGNPRDAYRLAHEEGGLDFFSLTDHGEHLYLWPWENKWETLKRAANDHYIPGNYVTFWGFEWSNPLLGHINLLNSEDFTDAFSTFELPDLYNWIAVRPQTIGRFNHPGDYNNLEIEFFHLAKIRDIAPQMIGIETWNGNDGFDEYYYRCAWKPSCNNSYLDHGNLQDWYLGSLGGQDNHKRQWGSLNQFRTAVLATELTREKILEALQQRRFYATEDKDLKMDFRADGYPMGSRLNNVARSFTVSACDESGDNFSQVRLYRDGRLFKSKSVSGNCFETGFDDTNTSGSHYYYTVVTQNDDNDGNGRNDEAISSPIWITTSN